MKNIDYEILLAKLQDALDNPDKYTIYDNYICGVEAAIEIVKELAEQTDGTMKNLNKNN